MKYLITIIALIIFSCKEKETENAVVTNEFIKIPYNLRVNYLDSLSKKIVPNRKYQYWQYATYRQGPGIETYIVLNEGGDSSFRTKINEKPRPNYNYGIFFGDIQIFVVITL